MTSNLLPVRVKLIVYWVSPSVVSNSLRPHGLSPPGSSVHGILQARILEWVAISFSRESSWPRDPMQVSCTAGRFFTIWATTEAWLCLLNILNNKCSRNTISFSPTGFSQPFLWIFSLEKLREIWEHTHSCSDISYPWEPEQSLPSLGLTVYKKTLEFT